MFVFWLVWPLAGRFALSHRGMFVQRHKRVRDPRICASFLVVLPLWMDVPSAEAPAFAGMTAVVQRSHRGRPLQNPRCRSPMVSSQGFVHPLRSAFRLLASPSRCEGDGGCRRDGVKRRALLILDSRVRGNDGSFAMVSYRERGGLLVED